MLYINMKLIAEYSVALYPIYKTENYDYSLLILFKNSNLNVNYYKQKSISL